MTDTTMLPDVAAYIRATEAAEYARNTEREAINKQYPFDSSASDYRITETSRARAEAQRESMARYHAALAAALDELKGSSDPLVAWIAANALDYSDEALKLLRELPMTVEEMDDFADDENWCASYTRLRLEAQQAGVLPGLEPRSPDEYALLEWVVERTSDRLSGTDLRRFDSLVDSIRAESHRAV